MLSHKPGFLAFSFASACIWGLIALGLGARAFGSSIWGGILAAPFIGLLVSASSVWFISHFQRGRVVFSLLSLYLAASLFGLAVGVYDVFVRGIGPGPSIENVFSGVAATLWGITFTGYFVFLWPLAHLNHKLLWKRLD